MELYLKWVKNNIFSKEDGVYDTILFIFAIKSISLMRNKII